MNVDTKVLVFLYRRAPDRVLLFQRKGRPGLGWHPVTGHAEPGDADPRTAALREVEEETGLQVGEVEDLKEAFRFTQVRDGESRTYEEHAFAAEVRDPAHVRLSEEHVAYTWMSFRNAGATLEHETQRRILLLLLARLAPRPAPEPEPEVEPEPEPAAGHDDAPAREPAAHQE